MTTHMDDGELRSADAIAAWLLVRLAERSGVAVSSLDAGERFSRLGLDSVELTALGQALGQALGRPVSPIAFYDHPSVAALSRHLAEGGAIARSTTTMARATHDEPIAVIGRACRFPQAEHPAAYWRLLLDGIDATREIPAARWDLEELYDADASKPGKMAARRGGFLERVDEFDPLFFGISPREAAQMDPQQRLMLELSWEALEDAGIVPGSLFEQPVGVFSGVSWFDYGILTQANRSTIGRYTATGFHHSIVANRVSYALGLRGSSLAVDTACSSSLSAVHLACTSLQRGESSVALAGGVQLNLLAESMLDMSKFGGLSPDGRCYSFDARANGYARSEGAGVLVLKRLSQAIRDGDRIDCVIVGTAMNNDGASNGLTAPSSIAQQLVLRQAYDRAGIDPGLVDYVEAHGTGTQLGDPIEADALGKVLGASPRRERPLLVGTAKSNLGHLETAAGMAGLLKASMVLEHGMVPPSVTFETPNPHIDFAGLRLTVPREPTALPAVDRPLVAGVSSFGFGGTNCHVVLQEAWRPRHEILALDADTREALRERVQAVLGQLAETPSGHAPGRRLRERCIGAVPGSARFRLAASVGSVEELERKLTAFLAGERAPGVALGEGAGSPERPIFVFSGQGSQWSGMGLSLLRSEPVFRAVIEECDEHIRQHLDWSLLDTLAGVTSSDFTSVRMSGPAIVAIEIAVAALLQSWGITPRLIVGHSHGEVTAAHVGGALDRGQAMRIICVQSRFAGRLGGRGGMAMVGLAWDEAEALERRYEGRIARAAHASPRSTVVAGDAEVLQQARSELERRGVSWHAVSTSVPFHGHELRRLRAALHDELGDVRPWAGEIPLFSSVSGGRVGGRELDATHWVRNLCDPVLFAEAIAAVMSEASERPCPPTFVEIAPHPILRRSIEECLAHGDRDGRVVVTLVRHEDGRVSMLDALAELYAGGQAVRWERLYPRPPSGPTLAAVAAQQAASSDELRLLLLSGRTLPDCLAQAGAHAELLAQAEDRPPLDDIVHTAARCRTHHRHRVAVSGTDVEQLAEALRAVRDGEPHARAVVAEASDGALAFAYSGQGSQWAGMGRELLARQPVFRRAIERVAEEVERWVTWSLIDEIVASEADGRLDHTHIAQPAIFAIQVALTELLLHWGIVPDAVVGHSVGEVAAAYVCGALSLEDAARLVVHRGRIMQSATGTGGMVQAEATVEQVRKALRGLERWVDIGAVNGDRAIVLSGRHAELKEASDRLEREGVSLRRLPVSYAFHSPLMEPLEDELEAALLDIEPRAPQRLMISTVTARPVEGKALGAPYWRDNMRRCVRFAEGIDALLERRVSRFVEVGPHPVLALEVERRLGTGGGLVTASLRRNRNEQHALMDMVARLWTRGLVSRVDRLIPAGHRVRLPGYPWQRQRCWLESSSTSSTRPSAGHPLLGLPFVVAARPSTRRWDQTLSLGGLAWLRDHSIRGSAVLPATGYVEMLLEAARQCGGEGMVELADLSFERMLIVDDEPRHLQVSLGEPEGHERWSELQIHSSLGSDAQLHARGRLRCAADLRVPDTVAPEPVPVEAQSTTAAEHYRRMSARGLEYGPSFRGVSRCWSVGTRTIAWVELPETASTSEGHYQWHPALLDACVQVLVTTVSGDESVVPVAIERLRAYRRPPGQVVVEATIDPSSLCGRLRITDARGVALMDVEGLQLRRLGAQRSAEDDRWLYAQQWQRAALPDAGETSRPGAAKVWLLLMDRGGVAAELHRRLLVRGHRCICVTPGSGLREHTEGLYEIDPVEPTQLQQVFERALSGRPCHGVIHLWSLDVEVTASTTSTDGVAGVDALWQAQRLGSESVLGVAQAVLRHGFRDPPRLWLVTRAAVAARSPEPGLGIGHAPLWGLARAIELEHPELRCTRVDLGSPARKHEIAELMAELEAAVEEHEIAYREDGRYVRRLLHASSLPSRPVSRRMPAGEHPFALRIERPGVLDELTLHAVERRPPGPGEVEIEVEATGLNFLDVLLALGMLPDEQAGDEGPRLGMELAGRVVALGEAVEGLSVGQRVMGLGFGCFRSFVTTPRALVTPMPEGLSFEEAATIPLAHATAYHALTHVGRLRAGERVLIHAGAGGVGIAAIRWAQHVGAEVFATAGSEEKRAFLRSLGVRHVMDSRTLRFADDIMEATNGEGVDVVLNSLSGQAIDRSLGVLRDHGRFLEIGKRDYYDDRQLGLRPFLRSLTFALVDLRSIMQKTPARLGALLDELQPLLASGVMRPLPLEALPVSRAAEAFNAMARARHIGKLVLTMRAPEAPIVHTRRAVRADATYLVTGGLGGICPLLAEHLVEHGARHLVLLGRRAASAATSERITRMRDRGARVEVVAADVTRADEVARVLARIDESMPPLRGVVHGAAVLDDGVLLNQHRERFRAVLAPKMIGAWNLHYLTAGRPLDWFVLLSSVASLLGSAGQGSYCAANAFMDALAHARQSQDLPALSINWGPWAGVGLAAKQSVDKRFAMQGMSSLSTERALAMFERLLVSPQPQLGAVPLDIPQWLQFHSKGSMSLFERLLAEGQGQRDVEPRGEQELRAALRAEPPARREALLSQHVREQVAHALWLKPEQIDGDTLLSALGVESLTALEIRRRLEATLGAQLPAALLWGSTTIADLVQEVARRIDLPLGVARDEREREHEAAGAGAGADAIDLLEDDEVAEQLAAQLAELERR